MAFIVSFLPKFNLPGPPQVKLPPEIILGGSVG
jgi:hypothetical protein